MECRTRNARRRGGKGGMNAPNHIRVWRFRDAPQELQDLSCHGGDEDWLALIPPKLTDDYIGWMESGSSFGCCDVSEHTHPELPGYVVRIGAHS
jgi:hypothetical protein